jgi:hypothetical protein
MLKTPELESDPAANLEGREPLKTLDGVCSNPAAFAQDLGNTARIQRRVPCRKTGENPRKRSRLRDGIPKRGRDLWTRG